MQIILCSLTLLPLGVTVTLNVPLFIAVDSNVAIVFRSGSCVGFGTSPIGGGLSNSVKLTVISELF